MTEIGFDSQDQIKHAYIIASDPATAFANAEKIAMAAVCRGNGRFPCGKCTACEKVRKNVHPDVKIIERLLDDKGKQKRELTVGQIREVSADAVILSNESRHKVYIFKDSECMNTEAQNAALKLLEEPPQGVILILCTSNPSVLLPTVRSRCAELNFASVPAERTERRETEETVMKYLSLAAGNDALALWKWCEANNEISVSEMTDFTVSAAEMITDILCGRKKNPGLSAERLMELERLMEKCTVYLGVNTNVKQLFGLIGTDTIPMPGMQKK